MAKINCCFFKILISKERRIIMPMSKSFEKRLLPRLKDIVALFGTPFHIYDEAGILETGEQLKAGFAGCHGFKEYFAVKANTNPEILKLMIKSGFGFDCSSIPELILARKVGAGPDDIMFTSNNTSQSEFLEAFKDGGCVLNLDDITLIDKMPGEFPELICFRYNPGPRRTGNTIIGNPVQAKYGITYEQIIPAYREARQKGAKRFGLHTMIVSNERKIHYHIGTVWMLLNIARMVKKELGIEFEFINMGGGIGVPYYPTHKPVDIFALGHKVAMLLQDFGNSMGYMPELFMENGRYLIAPHGVLVTTCINQKHIYREYRGVDACMSSLMRPAIYGAYHHITVLGGKRRRTEVVDVIGSLCENNDKFAIQRRLPKIQEGDILLIHESGGHGYAMCFQYNGRLRPKELMLRRDGIVELIRREEFPEDYFRTLEFPPERLLIK